MNDRSFVLFFLLILFTSSCNPDSSNLGESPFESFDKVKIAFTDEGKGEPIVLLHGFIVNGSSWNKSQVKQSLLDAGYRVIVPDLRGNGKSDIPQEAKFYQHDAEVKDLIALADHLKFKSYAVVGYSRGSIVLAKLLTQDKRIKKAVFGGMGLDFTNPNWDRRIAFANAFTGRVQPDEMTKGAIDYAKSINADIKALGFLQDYQPVTSIQELKGITIPTLVICGDQDKDNGDPTAFKNQLANGQLLIIEGDHNNTYKQKNFAEGVLAFLSN